MAKTCIQMATIQKTHLKTDPSVKVFLFFHLNHQLRFSSSFELISSSIIAFYYTSKHLTLEVEIQLKIESISISNRICPFIIISYLQIVNDYFTPSIPIPRKPLEHSLSILNFMDQTISIDIMV